MEYKELFEQEQKKNGELEGKLAEFSSEQEKTTSRITDLEAENAELKKKIDEMSEKTVKAEFEAYAEGLISKKKLLPDQKEATVDELMTMYKASQIAEFSAEGVKSPLDLLKARLENAVVTIPGSGHSADNRGAEFSGDGNPNDLADRAVAYRAEQKKLGKNVSITEAVRHLSRK